LALFSAYSCGLCSCSCCSCSSLATGALPVSALPPFTTSPPLPLAFAPGLLGLGLSFAASLPAAGLARIDFAALNHHRRRRRRNAAAVSLADQHTDQQHHAEPRDPAHRGRGGV
jgi:hypothetical protein